MDEIDLKTAGDYRLIIYYNGQKFDCNISVYDPSSISVIGISFDRDYIIEYSETTGELLNLDNYRVSVYYSSGVALAMRASEFTSVKVRNFASDGMSEIAVTFDGNEYILSAYLVTSLKDVKFEYVEQTTSITLRVGESFDSSSYYDVYAQTSEGYSYEVSLNSTNVFELDGKATETLTYVPLDTTKTGDKVAYVKINEEYFQIKISIVDENEISFLNIDLYSLGVQETKEETILKLKETLLSLNLNVHYYNGKEEVVSISEDMIFIDDNFENEVDNKVNYTVTYKEEKFSFKVSIRPNFENDKIIGTYTAKDDWLNGATASSESKERTLTLYDNGYLVFDDNYNSCCNYIVDGEILKMGNYEAAYYLFTIDEETKTVSTLSIDESKIVSTYKCVDDSVVYSEFLGYISYITLYSDGKVSYYIADSYLVFIETDYEEGKVELKVKTVADVNLYIILDIENNTFYCEMR